MTTQISDTDPKIEEMRISMIRKSKITDRISLLNSLSQTVIRLSRKAIARANPGKSEEELNYLFVKYHYGEETAKRIKDFMAESKL